MVAEGTFESRFTQGGVAFDDEICFSWDEQVVGEAFCEGEAAACEQSCEFVF